MRRKNKRDPKAIQKVGAWMYASDPFAMDKTSLAYYDKAALNNLKATSPFLTHKKIQNSPQVYIGEYADFVNFSAVVDGVVLDDIVADAAKSMVKAATEKMNKTIQMFQYTPMVTLQGTDFQKLKEALEDDEVIDCLKKPLDKTSPFEVGLISDSGGDAE